MNTIDITGSKAKMPCEGKENMMKANNVAAMREALEKISKKIWDSIDPKCNDDCCRSWRELAKIADAALDAPPRNCDMFRTAEEAQNAFLKQTHVLVSWPTLENVTNWLFAPAKKEGGAE